jgi:hypothetical protein
MGENLFEFDLAEKDIGLIMYRKSLSSGFG